MKKKLNVFCVLLLVLKAAQIIIGNVMGFGENVQAFQQGWEDGINAPATTASGFGYELAMVSLGLACLFLVIRSLIAFVRFILNVNRDKVFVWDNVPLLRWSGWGILIPTVVFTIHDLLTHVPTDKIYDSSIDNFVFGLFCLIVAEVFTIGLKLQEEQDLTI